VFMKNCGWSFFGGRLCVILLCAAFIPFKLLALTADDLDDAIGYTVIATSSVTASGENDDGDVFVKVRDHGEFVLDRATLAPLELSNVVILAESTVFKGKAITLYKLVIDDDIYDAHR